MNCPRCQKPLAPSSRFCGGCGLPVENVSQPAARPFNPAPAAAGAPAASVAFGATDHRSGAAAAGLIERAKNMILSPRHEWEVIAPESSGIAQLYAGYVIPLSIFAAVFTFVHVSLIGVRVPFAGLVRSPISAGLTTAVLSVVFGLLGVFLFSLIVNGLAPTFGGVRDQTQAMKVAAYSLTPAWLSSVLALSPVLPSLLQFLAGCYGIYVLYLGLPPVMRAPRERAAGYTATVVICCILVGVLFGALSAAFGHFGLRSGLAGLTAEQHEASRDQAAQQVGNVIGNMLGTDEKGKEGLGAAISNLAKAGEQMEKQQAAGNAAAASNAGGNTADAGSTAGAAQSAPAAEPAQSPMGAVGGLLNALGGSLGGPNRVEPVSTRTLSGLLPQNLAGMKRSHVKSEGNSAIGIKTTRAEADYSNADGTAHLEIADISGVSGLMDLANGLVKNTTSESDAGYEKDVDIGGRSAHEKWDAHAKKGEISMIIAKRFSVDVTGDGVPMSLLEQAYGDIDLAGLEAMKGAGAQH